MTPRVNTPQLTAITAILATVMLAFQWAPATQAVPEPTTKNPPTTAKSSDSDQSGDDASTAISQRVAEGYDVTGTKFEGADSPTEGKYLGEGQYQTELDPPEETGTNDERSEGAKKWFKIAIPADHTAVVTANLTVPDIAAMEDIKPRPYLRAELEVQNSTCDFEDAGSFESTYWPQPSTASVLRFGGEEDCNPNEYEVTVFRGGSRGPTLPAEIRVGFEPKVKPADKGPEDPGDEPKEGKADKLVHASDAKTHAGGRSYSTAERIEPGTIKGSIAPGESLYYRFPVSWGQRPIAKVTFEPTKKKPRSRNGQIEIATPMRTIESNYSFESLTNDKPVSTSHDKSSFAYYQNREDGNGKQRSWAYAGDYYAIVSVDGYKDNFAPSEENKFTLTVDTDGAPVNGPDWQMPTEDGPEPSDTAPGADAGADGDGGGNAADADASPNNAANQSDSGDGANAKFYITGSVIMVVLLLGLIIGSWLKGRRQP